MGREAGRHIGNNNNYNIANAKMQRQMQKLNDDWTHNYEEQSVKAATQKLMITN